MFSVFNIFIVILYIAAISHGQEFSYEGNNGPTHWGEKFQHCVGKHQSPINIQEHNVQIVHLPPMIFTNFIRKPKSATLKNSGHTVVLTMVSDNKPSITGGPLIGNYEFAQLHFHWGAHDNEGSENTINNSSYPMELHVVFYEKAYGTFEEATEHPDGLTVFSFLFSRSDEENPNYRTLLAALPLVQNPKTQTVLHDPPLLEELVIQNRSTYFTYGGSLTTPPCSEVVTWIEFKNTIPLSHNQIEKFRHLNGDEGKLIHNFRPVQPLHGRTIRMNKETKNEIFSSQHHSSLQSTNAAFNITPTIIFVSTILSLQYFR